MLTMNLRPTLTFFFLLCFLLFIAAEEKEQKTITAESGQTVTLPCQTPNNNNNIVVKWSRADLESGDVFLYRDEQFDPERQHPSFKNRVDLQDRQMKDGDVSVILKNVTINDTGTYECHVVHRVKTPMKLISIIYLSVAPPPGPGGTTEDGGKEDGGKEDGGKEDEVSRGHYGLIVSLSVAAVVLVLVLVGVAVFVNQQKTGSSDELCEVKDKMLNRVS